MKRLGTFVAVYYDILYFGSSAQVTVIKHITVHYLLRTESHMPYGYLLNSVDIWHEKWTECNMDYF